MRTNVSELLRNFPTVQRAALSGERVIIETREGNLVLTAEKPQARSLFGALTTMIDARSLRESDAGAEETDWNPSL